MAAATCLSTHETACSESMDQLAASTANLQHTFSQAATTKYSRTQWANVIYDFCRLVWAIDYIWRTTASISFGDNPGTYTYGSSPYLWDVFNLITL